MAISAPQAEGRTAFFTAILGIFRILSSLINGMPPLLLGSNLRDDNSALTVDLTNPDIYFNEQLALPKDTLHLVRTLFLWRGCVFHRLDIRNHGDAHLKFNISFAFDNDFADLFEVRGLKRVQRGKSAMRSDPGFGRTEIKYEGIDGKIRTSVLVFDPPPTNLPKNLASYELDCNPLSTIPPV